MEINNLSFAYADKVVLENINLKIKKGSITTIMGANGSGKTTLLNLLARNLKCKSGEITLYSKNIQSYSSKEYAREVGIVYQQNRLFGDVTVKNLVSYGRLAYLKPLQRFTSFDKQCIREALELTNLQKVADVEVRKLSGGQRQRVFLAMALAQKSKILLLDEPTTYLDIKYQVEILNLIRSINKQFGVTIVMVLHDIMQTINYSEQVVGLLNGKIQFNGKPSDVLNNDVISALYDTELIMDSYKDMTIVLPKMSTM